MNDKQLRYFIAIADAGSFRSAADILRIAQPALSRQIQQLEDSFGVALFFRGSKGIRLTAAGELLLERARFLDRHREQTRADVTARGTIPTGTVGFGAPPSIADVLFQPLALSYLAAYPNVKLSFFEGVGHLHQLLHSGKIDLAILPNGRLLDGGDYAVMNFVAEPVYLVGAKGRLGDAAEISPSEAMRLPLILTAPPSTVRALIDRSAELSGHNPKIVAETESSGIQKMLVAAGLGYAILPHSAVYADYKADRLSLALIRNWKLQRVLAWRADRPLTAAVKRMVEHTQAAMTTLSDAGVFGSV